MSTLTRLRKFAGLDSADQALFFRALFWVAVVRAALWILPFRFVCQLVTRASREGGRKSPSDTGKSLEAITRAVDIAARRIPVATCLTQALAAKILLARAGYLAELRIGVLPTQTRLKAHAWLECDGRVVIGDVPGLADFAALPPI